MGAHVVVTEAEMAAARQAVLAEARTRMTPRELEAFDLYWGLTSGTSLTFSDVAQRMGVVASTVWRKVDHAEAKYRRRAIGLDPWPLHRQYFDIISGRADDRVDSFIELSCPEMYSGVDRLLPPIRAAYLAEHERLAHENGGDDEDVGDRPA